MAYYLLITAESLFNIFIISCRDNTDRFHEFSLHLIDMTEEEEEEQEMRHHVIYLHMVVVFYILHSKILRE